MNNQYAVDQCRKALNLGEFATLEAMKKGFRIFQKQNHPDKGGDPNVFIMVQKACEWLTRKTEKTTRPKAEKTANSKDHQRGEKSRDSHSEGSYFESRTRSPGSKEWETYVRWENSERTGWEWVRTDHWERPRSSESSGDSKHSNSEDQLVYTMLNLVYMLAIVGSIASLATNALYSLFGIEKNVEQTIVKNNESTITENVEPETTNVLDNQAQKTLEISTSTPTITLAYENSKNIENSSKPVPSDELTTEAILHNNDVNNDLRFAI